MNGKYVCSVLCIVGVILGKPSGSYAASSKEYESGITWKGRTTVSMISTDETCVTTDPWITWVPKDHKVKFTATCKKAPCTATVNISGILPNGNPATESRLVKCSPCPEGRGGMGSLIGIGLECESDTCTCSAPEDLNCVYDFAFDCPGPDCATCYMSVPTVSGWGLLIMTLLTIAAATVMLRRQRVADRQPV